MQTLKEIKNDLIGNDKKAYFDKGLIETIVPFVLPSTDPLVLYECIAILNSFTISFASAIDVFKIY